MGKKKKSCPVKARLRRHLPMLQILHKASPRLRRAIINSEDKSLVTTLGECALNVVSGNQKISPKCKNNLKKYKNQLRQLAASPRHVSHQKKKKILMQKGGFIIPTLVGAVLSGLLSKVL